MLKVQQNYVNYIKENYVIYAKIKSIICISCPEHITK